MTYTMESTSGRKTVDLVTRFKKFLWDFRDRRTGAFKYRERLSQMALMGQRSLVIDFNDITLYDRGLAHIIENEPDTAIEAASKAIKELLMRENPEYAESIEKFYPRFRNPSRVLKIRELTSEYIGKFVAIEGILTRLTRVEAKLVKAVFRHEDPECGAEFEWPEEGEIGDRIEKPTYCPVCGKATGKFKLLLNKSKFTDWQKIVVQEKPEEIPPGQIPRSIEVILTGDLVDSARPGDRVLITGILRVLPTSSIQRSGGKSIFAFYLEANYVDVQQKVLEEIEITREDEDKIRELARDPWIREKIVASIAPAIYGHWNIKEAIALLLFGGVPKLLPDGTRIRGDIHVLLVGDPGTAKSQLLQYTAKIAPRGIYTSGKGSTAAGLCVLPNTYIVLEDGTITTIKELIDKNNKGKTVADYKTKILSFNKDTFELNYYKTVKAWRLKDNKIVKLTTKTGVEIGVTPETPILVIRDNTVKWIKASELRPGDYIARIRYYVRNDNEGNTSILNTIDQYIDKYKPELGYLLGYIFGNGRIIIHDNSKQIEIETRSEEVTKYISLLIKDLLGIEPIIEDDKVIINSEKFLKLVEKLGFNDDRNKIVLDPVLTRLDDGFIKMFIAGVFDSNRVNTESQYIGIDGNKDLIYKLHLLLLRYGVFSIIIKDKDHYRLLIRDRENLTRYLDTISSPISSIRDYMRKIIDSAMEDNEYENIPLPLVRDILVRNGIMINEERSISRRKLEEIISIINNDYDKEYLKKLLSTPIIWDEVREVSIINGEHIVYDLTVEDSHSFIANTMVVHNTASVLKDKATGEYYLEAGALVLADGGVACLHPDTRVLVNNEYVKIEELFSEDKIIHAESRGEPIELNYKLLNVVGINIKDLKAVNALSTIIRRKKWRGKLVKIKLRSGYVITLTPDHWLIDGDTLEWREAGEFRIGDRILSIRKIPGHNNDFYIFEALDNEWRMFVEIPEATIEASINYLTELKHRDPMMLRNLNITYMYKNTIEKPKTNSINAKLGYLLGYIYNTIIGLDYETIMFELSREDDKERIIEYIVNTINVMPRIEKYNDREYIIARSPLLSHIYRYFTRENLRNIFKLPDNVLKAYIAGFYDSNNKIVSNNELYFRFRNRGDAETYTLVLRRFDIYSKIITGNETIYVVIDDKQSLGKLYSIINKYGKERTIPKLSGSINNREDIIPHRIAATIANKILSYLSKAGIKDSGTHKLLGKVISGDSVLHKNDLRKIVKRIKPVIPENIMSIINVLVTNDYYVDEIKDIEYIDYEGPVYDLYVPGIHNFLAGGIIVHNCIDEIDKMRDEDRSAIHEALEQQSYHKNFQLMLANGESVSIGDLVESLINKYRDKVVYGKDTEILFLNNIDHDIFLLAYNLENGEEILVKADRVSRHKAPEKFIRIRFSNGLEAIVTPEHPIPIIKNGRIEFIRADSIRKGYLTIGVSIHRVLGNMDDTYIRESIADRIEQDKSLPFIKAISYEEALKLHNQLLSLGIQTFIVRENDNSVKLYPSSPCSLRNIVLLIGNDDLVDDKTIDEIIHCDKYPTTWYEILYSLGILDLISIYELKGLDSLIGIIENIDREIRSIAKAININENNSSELAYLTTRRKLLTRIRNKLNTLREKLKEFEEALGRDTSLRIISDVEIIDNNDSKWVYDVTVEPYHLFVSHGLVFHNTVSIAKAGIVARLNARASVLAAGNPKLGRYDPTLPVSKNIDLPPPILSRFDLIFIVEDIPDKTKDTLLAKHILDIHTDYEKARPLIDIQLLKKYISYARRYIRPKLTQDAKKLLLDFYVSMRMSSIKSGEGPPAIAMTPRQLEALIRLSEAHAKMALKTKATVEDAEEAIRLMYYSLRKVGYDVKSGRMDIDVLELGVPRSKQVKMKEFLRFIDKLFEEYDEIEYKELYRIARDRGFEKEFVVEMIRRLKKEGVLYEPRPGVLARVG